MSTEILPFCPLFFCRKPPASTPLGAGCPLFLPPRQPAARFFYCRLSAVGHFPAGSGLPAFFTGNGPAWPVWRFFSRAVGLCGPFGDVFRCRLAPPLFCPLFPAAKLQKRRQTPQKIRTAPILQKRPNPRAPPPPIYKNRRRCVFVPFFWCRRPQPKNADKHKKADKFLLNFSGGSCFAVFSEAEKKRTKGQDYSRIRRFKVCGCSFSKSNDLSTFSLVCRRKKRTKGQDYSPNSSLLPILAAQFF